MTEEIDDIMWSIISLKMATRGMDEEDEPTYTMADLKEVFATRGNVADNTVSHSTIAQISPFGRNDTV